MPYEDSNEEKYWSAIKIGDKWSYCGRITKIETGDDPESFHTCTWDMRHYPDFTKDDSTYTFTIKVKGDEEPMTDDEKELHSDINFMQDNLDNLIELRKKKGFVTYQDLAECLDLDPDTEYNPYRLYVGNWDAYEKWVREAAIDIYRMLRKVDKEYAAVCKVQGRCSEKAEAIHDKLAHLQKLLDQCNEALDDKDEFEEVED